jgi:hypothetical protein
MPDTALPVSARSPLAHAVGRAPESIVMTQVLIVADDSCLTADLSPYRRSSAAPHGLDLSSEALCRGAIGTAHKAWTDPVANRVWSLCADELRRRNRVVRRSRTVADSLARGPVGHREDLNDLDAVATVEGAAHAIEYRLALQDRSFRRTRQDSPRDRHIPAPEQYQCVGHGPRLPRCPRRYSAAR